MQFTYNIEYYVTDTGNKVFMNVGDVFAPTVQEAVTIIMTHLVDCRISHIREFWVYPA